MNKVFYITMISFGLFSCSEDINSKSNNYGTTVANESSLAQVHSSIQELSDTIFSSSSSLNFEVLLNEFPKGQVKPDSSLIINWNIDGILKNNFKVFLDLKYLNGEYEVYKMFENINSISFDLKAVANASRVQLRVRILSDGVERSDQTQFFDVHSGVTVFKYEQNIQKIFSMYCTECHGSEGGLNLETYAKISKRNTPLYIMNRVHYIGDMPPKSSSSTLSINEKEMLRDWILGGYPK